MMRVKDWKKFQHYNHRNPPWIKLHKALLDDPDWHALPPLASKVLAMCWLVASESDGELPASSKLAFRLRMSVDALEGELAKLSHWLTQDASEMLAPCLQSATTETETETEKKVLRRVAKATTPNLEFEQFWKAYPARRGDNPKAPARKLFEAAVKQGADPQAIISGVKAACARNQDKIGTEFIPQAVKWLRDRRWEDYATNGAAPNQQEPSELVRYLA